MKIKNVKDEINSAVTLTDTLLSQKADRSDIEREATANLNIRNDIGKLGQRIQKLERKDS